MKIQAIALVFVFLSVSISGLGAQPVRVEQDEAADSASISIDAPGGIVEWRNVARGIARAENLDEDAVASLLPPGTLNLNSVAAQWVISGLNVALLRSLSLVIERDGGVASALRVSYDRNGLRRTLNAVKGIAQQALYRWGGQEANYGLFIDEDWRSFSPARALVVIVHGYSSGPDEFDALRVRLREAGFPCAVFAYPNDAAVARSGRQLAAALQALGRQYPERRLTLVAHSMGGLLSRVAIEDPDTGPVDNVDRLVMVATPNGGSNLARVPVSLDVWENWLDGEPDTVRSVFFESVLDGLNEARFDLQPQSELLTRLNALPRNPDVRYSLILGNRGPATREQLDELRRWILSSQDSSTVLRALGPRLDELLADLDELVNGLGDGAVALERGRLEGVEDTIVLPFSHGAITSTLTDATGERLLAEILRRLDRR